MPVIMKSHIKISTARVVSIYLICAIWSAFSPLETYFSGEVVEQSQLVVSLLTFVVGVVTITITLLLLARHNRSLKGKAGPGT